MGSGFSYCILDYLITRTINSIFHSVMNKQKLALLVSIITSAVIWRVSFSSGALANFSPIGAIALFSACYFSNKKLAYIATIASLVLSDLVLNYFVYSTNFTLFYPGLLWNYLGLALIVLIGSLIKKVNLESIFLSSSLAAFTHWFISDLGVWLHGTLYPKTFEGLVACFVAAIPFLQNMFLGNLFFSCLMFGAFEFAGKRLKHSEA